MTVNDLIDELKEAKVRWGLGEFDVTLDGKPISRVAINSDEVVIESEDV